MTIEYYLARFDEIDHTDDEARESLFTAFRDAARENPGALTSAVRTVPLDRYTHLHEVYEALSVDSKIHGPFFVAEAIRLLDALSDASNGRHPLEALEAFEYVEDETSRRGIYQALESRAGDPAPHVRRAVAWVLPNFHDTLSPDQRRLYERLSEDEDWRVRVLARCAINEYDGRPLEAGLSLRDKVRQRIRDVHDW